MGDIATDTRTLTPGAVFVALRGERFDGHDFLGVAVAAGAGAVVVSDPGRAAGLGRPVFVVTDTTRALGALGSYRRRAWGRPVVAVTGSNGKTGTKELLRAALGAAFDVHATSGNLNNEVGVPLTLLAIPDEADVAVVEIGTNHPGEVGRLRDIVLPDVCVVTSIGEEHLEGFGDIEGVLREEVSVCRDVALAVVPSAQPEVGGAARALARRVIEAGLDPGSDFAAENWGLDAGGRVWLSLAGVPQRCELPLLGAHNARNAMLALAVADAMGVEKGAAMRGISGMSPLSMRGEWTELGTLTVINDAYNANPASMREALTLIDALVTDRPRVVLLGSMLELGTTSDALHLEIARRAVASRAAVVGGCGAFAPALTLVAPVGERVVVGATPEELWERVAARIAPDAVVLLKGSRGMRLERLLGRLAALGGAVTPEGVHAAH